MLKWSKDALPSLRLRNLFFRRSETFESCFCTCLCVRAHESAMDTPYLGHGLAKPGWRWLQGIKEEEEELEVELWVPRAVHLCGSLGFLADRCICDCIAPSIRSTYNLCLHDKLC